MRMAAVFTLTTVTIARRTEIVSRWLTVAGIATALVLLVGVGISPWVELLFPVWILAVSIDILAAGPRAPPAPPKRHSLNNSIQSTSLACRCRAEPRLLFISLRNGTQRSVDPTRDVSALRSLHWVMKGGQVVRDNRIGLSA